jgi:pimeloyl-ACP methyl ester carboxylesterase
MGDGSRSGTASLNGIEMYYQLHGRADAEPLVLLHGFTGIGGDWRQPPGL